MFSTKMKFLCLELSLAALLSLASCSSEKDSGNPNDETNPAPKTETQGDLNTAEESVPESTEEETAKTTEPDEDSTAAIGRQPCNHCTVLGNGTIVEVSYHQISGELINYIGDDAFQKWTEKYDYQEDFNIVNFIRDNNIPREFIDEINSKYGSVYYFYDYNTDALYSDNPDEYYTSDRAESTMVRAFLLNFKSGLWEQIRNSDGYDEWVAEKAKTDSTFDGDMRRWSISEVIEHFDISREIIDGLANRASGTTIGTCEIDVDALYNSPVNDIEEEKYLVVFDSAKYTEVNQKLAEGFEYNP